MEAIVYNYMGSRIHPLIESACLRAAYLLCDHATLAGDSYNILLFKHYFNPKRLEDKIDKIEEYCELNGEESFKTEAAEARKVLKAFRKIKHPSSAIITDHKVFERHINNIFEQVKKQRLEKFEQTGLPQLQPLYDNGGFGLYPVKYGSPENDEGDFIAASELFQFNLPEENYSPPIFFLTTDFFLPEFITKWDIAKPQRSKASKPDVIYLEKCFMLPNVNRLTSAELEIVHRQLSLSAGEFWKKMDEWITLSHEDASAADTNRFFTREVLPTTAELLDAIAKNELLQHCSRLHDDKIMVEVLLGEMPVQVIWEFYRYFGAIQDETWEKLMAARESDPSLYARWPVMLLRDISNSEDEREETEQEEIQEQVLPVKKSISID